MENDVTLHIVSKLKSLTVNGNTPKETKKLTARAYGYDTELLYQVSGMVNLNNIKFSYTISWVGNNFYFYLALLKNISKETKNIR